MKKLYALLALAFALVTARRADATITVTGNTTSPQCYLALIHGYGTTDMRPGIASDSTRLGYWRNSINTSYSDFTSYINPSGSCAVLVVGYNGPSAFWDDAAAGSAVNQINEFIDRYAIASNSLVILAHSMGGLVTRWIENNGVNGAAYYNYHGFRYDRVVTASRYFITLASPHLGATPADQIWGSSDTLCGWFVGTIAGLLGQRNDATQYMTRWNMEYASASGSWYQDAGRTRRMYTVATRRWDSAGGTSYYNTVEDGGLAGIWDCIGYTPRSDNWLTFWTDETRAATPGDGLVTELSGAGQYASSGSNYNSSWGTRSWSAGQWVQGARSDWLHTDHNHQHIRFDDLSLPITNNRAGTASTGFPASYIRSYVNALSM